MLWRTAFALLALVVVGAPIARGTVHTPVIGIAVALVTAAFLASSLNYIVRRRPPAVPVLGWIFCAIALVTVFQTIDLPAAVIRLLSPKTHEALSFALEKIALYGDGTSRPLSLDPPATEIQAVFGLGIMMALVLAYRAGRRANGLRDIQFVLLVSATLVLLVSFAFRIFQFSLWPEDRGVIHAPGVLSSTFRNINHFAAILALALPTAIGFAIDEERTTLRRALAALLACLFAIAIVLTRSRGGLVAGAVGAVSLALLLRSGTSARFGRRAVWGLALIVMVAGSVAMWFGAKRLFGKFSPEVLERELSDEGRARLWKDSLRLARDYPTLGVGRGAFIVAFPSVKSDLSPGTASHSENEPLLWVAEWGFVAGGALIVALIVVLAMLAFTSFGCAGAGGVAGLFGLAIHNLVDFNLEMGGVAFPAVVLLGALLGRRSRLMEQRRLEAGKSIPRRRRLAFAVVAVVPLTITLLATSLPKAARHDRDTEITALRRLAVNPSVSTDDWMRAARGVLSRHPIDPYLHLAIAGVLSSESRRDEGLAIYFLNRALFFNPSAAEVHLLATRLFIATGRLDQAIVEARLTVERAKRFATDVLWGLHLAHALDAESFERIVPDRSHRAELLRWLISNRLWAIASAAANEILQHDPTRREALETLVEKAFEEKDFANAEKPLEKLATRPESAGVASYWRGRISQAKGRIDDAVRAFREALKAQPPSVNAAYDLERILAGRRQFREAVDVLESVALADTSVPGRTSLHLRLGVLLDEAGDLVRARRELERARRLAPGRADVAWALLHVLERGRDWDGAMELCAELKEMDGQRTAVEKKMREIEAVRARQAERRREIR